MSTPAIQSKVYPEVKIEKIHHPFTAPIVTVTNTLCPKCKRKFLRFVVIEMVMDLLKEAAEMTGYYQCDNQKCGITREERRKE